MDIRTERNLIIEKIDKIVSEKFGMVQFDGYCLIPYGSEPDDTYKPTLEVFKYLFSMGEECKIYLWEKFFYVVDVEESIERVEKNDDFTEEEKQFFRYIYQANENSFIPGNINKDIETERLILTPFNEELNNKYIDFLINNSKEFENYYQKDYVKIDIKNGCGQLYKPLSFAILLKDTRELIGSVALTEKFTQGVYNLEYIIFPDYRRKGFVYEAVSTLIDKVKNKELLVAEETLRRRVYNNITPNIVCVVANIRENNIPSLSLIEKLGFTFDGKTPFAFYTKGQYHTSRNYHMEI